MTEIWKPIEGFELYYAVSNLGRVKNVKRDRILKPRTVYGYKAVSLYKTGQLKPKSLRVHRIVAAAFISNPDSKLQVNHKNGNRSDNRLNNLEWVTPSENKIHSLSVLKKGLGENHGLSKLTPKTVEEIRAATSDLKGLSKRLGITYSTVWRVRTRKIWRHL